MDEPGRTVIPPPGTALVEELDEKLMVQLRDGRKIMGVLRSFDQFANLVLEYAVERLITGNVFADIPLGLYVVRGENVVWMGRLDPASDGDGPPGVTRAPEAEVRRAVKAEREADKLKRGMKARMDFLDLE